MIKILVSVFTVLNSISAFAGEFSVGVVCHAPNGYEVRISSDNMKAQFNDAKKITDLELDRTAKYRGDIIFEFVGKSANSTVYVSFSPAQMTAQANIERGGVDGAEYSSLGDYKCTPAKER